MSLDPDSYRAVLGRFASGVTVVTSRDHDGRDVGMTVSAFCSVSLEPPLILVCLDRTARMEPLLAEGTPFVVNILAAGQEALSRRFSGTDPNRFEGVGFSRAQGGVALLDDVLAHLECRTAHRYAGGDHTIVVGQVESATVHPDAPLLYYRSGYTQLER